MCRDDDDDDDDGNDCDSGKNYEAFKGREFNLKDSKKAFL